MKKLIKTYVVITLVALFTFAPKNANAEFLSQVITRDQDTEVPQKRLAKRSVKKSLWESRNKKRPLEKKSTSLWKTSNTRLSPEQKIAKAMGIVESGGKPIVGASGEIKSVWQYTQPTWNSISKKYNKAVFGINKSLPPTRDNEEKVTVWKVKDLMGKGFNAEQIALIWNTSLAGCEKPLRRVGTNKYGVKYDSPNHARKVVREWKKLK